MYRSTIASLVLVLGGFAWGLACPTTVLAQEKAVDDTQTELKQDSEKQDSEKKAESAAAESEKTETEKAGSEKSGSEKAEPQKQDAATPALEKEAAKEKAEDTHAPAGRTDAAHTEAAHSDTTHGDAAHGAAGHAAGHGGHGHDTTDLSHQNAGAKIADPSEWKSDLAVSTLVVFLCLLALLTKFAWRPIMEGLQKREQGIAAQIEEAKRSAESAALQLRQYEARLAAATEEARGIVEQARRDAETAKDRILAEAQEVAKRERQRAIDDITAAKNGALQEMTQKSVDLAVSMAGKLIRKQLRPEDHSQLIREMVEQFPSRN